MSESVSGIKMAQASRPKVPPKVLDHIRIKPALGGGTMVEHHYTSYQHEPKTYNFGADEGGRAAKHIARHAGLPLDKNGDGDAEDEEPTARDDNAEKDKGPRKAAVKGRGSNHANAKAAHTEEDPED